MFFEYPIPLRGKALEEGCTTVGVLFPSIKEGMLDGVGLFGSVRLLVPIEGSGSEPDFIPNAPVHRERSNRMVLAALSEGIQERIRCGVVHLSRRRRNRTRRGIKNEKFRARFFEQTGKHLRAVHLRPEDALDSGIGLQLNEFVCNNTCRMEHAVNFAEALTHGIDTATHLIEIRHVRSQGHYLCTGRFQSSYATNTA